MGDLIKKYDGGHFTEGLFYDTIKPMENSSEKLFYTLITGATGGIGRAFAETLAAKGQNLFLTGRSADKLNALKEELSSKYPSLRLIVFACDLTDERSRAEMYKTIDAQGVVFDRLCNVAGADIQKAFEKYTEKKIVFQCRVNLEATLSVTRFVLSRRAKYGMG